MAQSFLFCRLSLSHSVRVTADFFLIRCQPMRLSSEKMCVEIKHCTDCKSDKTQLNVCVCVSAVRTASSGSTRALALKTTSSALLMSRNGEQWSQFPLGSDHRRFCEFTIIIPQGYNLLPFSSFHGDNKKTNFSSQWQSSPVLACPALLALLLVSLLV